MRMPPIPQACYIKTVSADAAEAMKSLECATIVQRTTANETVVQ